MRSRYRGGRRLTEAQLLRILDERHALGLSQSLRTVQKDAPKPITATSIPYDAPPPSPPPTILEDE